MDLYYDPVIDQHVSTPLALMAPVWYLAPQRTDMAKSAWEMAATLTGLFGDGDLVGLNDPNLASLLAMQTGDFTDGEAKTRLWEFLDETHEPQWNNDLGEFTFGFGLGEPHPRGQLNARAMAGWVCTPGAWSRIFNNPNLEKFDGPTVSGLDFPRVAMSEAWWDGAVLHLTAHAQNSSVANTQTSIHVEGLPSDDGWGLVQPTGGTTPIAVSTGASQLELVVNGGHYELRQL
ncbi:MAG: hypothetical protein VYA26_06145 [Actinomycetota bacterium]|nr:hypothetical protein [Actinomycetota bacterium]MED5438826.1 hypothetical protein [Actinomycetota bacterium]